MKANCACGKAGCSCSKKLDMRKLDAGALLKQFRKTGTVMGAKPKDVRSARKSALAQVFAEGKY